METETAVELLSERDQLEIINFCHELKSLQIFNRKLKKVNESQSFIWFILTPRLGLYAAAGLMFNDRARLIAYCGIIIVSFVVPLIESKFDFKTKAVEAKDLVYFFERMYNEVWNFYQREVNAPKPTQTIRKKMFDNLDHWRKEVAHRREFLKWDENADDHFKFWEQSQKSALKVMNLEGCDKQKD